MGADSRPVTADGRVMIHGLRSVSVGGLRAIIVPRTGLQEGSNPLGCLLRRIMVASVRSAARVRELFSVVGKSQFLRMGCGG